MTVYSQGTVSPEDRALLNKLKQDHSFFEIDRDVAEWLDEINNSKWSLYRAFQERSPTPAKVFQRNRAGWRDDRVYTFTFGLRAFAAEETFPLTATPNKSLDASGGSMFRN